MQGFLKEKKKKKRKDFLVPALLSTPVKKYSGLPYTEFFRFGSAGFQEKINALCVLALNVINDKVTLGEDSGPSMCALCRCLP